MKVAIFDHLGVHKTTYQIEKELKRRGHEVKWNMYYDMREKEDYIEWCDIALFEWLEGMVETCLKDGWGKKKPVYARAMDIEIWAGQAAREDITDLTGLAYTSKALFEIMKNDDEWYKKYPHVPTYHIPLSIDVNKWTYKKRNKGYNVAILGHMWDAKGPQMIPQF